MLTDNKLDVGPTQHASYYTLWKKLNGNANFRTIQILFSPNRKSRRLC